MRDNNLAQKLESPSDLDRPVLTTIKGGQKNIIDPLDEVTMRKTKRQHIREFGLVISCAFVIIASMKLFKGGNLNTILIPERFKIIIEKINE